MKINLFIVSAFSLLTLVGCGQKGSADTHNHTDSEAAHAETCTDHDHSAEKEHDHTAEAGHEGHDHGAAVPETDNHDAGVITLSDTQAKELGITYETVQPGSFANVIRTGGAIESAPGDRSTVVATTSGIVSFGGRRLTEGTRVTQGSPLVILGSEGMADGNYPQQLADARAELRKAENDYQRAENLSGDRIVSAADLDAARTALELAQRRVAVLSQNATKGGRSIPAPIGGYVTTLSVNEGDYVTAGQPIATIATNRNLVLRADLPQRYQSQAGEIRSANFTTPYNGENHDLAGLNGKLIGTARTVGAGSATLPVRFEFDNRNTFTPGSVVEVYLKGSPRENVLSVPVTALTEEQGAHYVYLRTAPEHYAKRAVKTGTSDGSRIEILSGVNPGEEVVVSGPYYIRLASMSNAIPSGHSH